MGRHLTRWIALCAICFVLTSLIVVAGPAGAVISGQTGAVQRIAPPTSVTATGICSADKVLVFDELQGVTLGAPVKYQYKDPGTYTGPPSSMGSVPAGTVVDSHFLDSNLQGCLGTPVRDATWTFGQDILGVIVGRSQLDNSDFLGIPTTNYGGAYPSREFEWGAGN